jgi:hypothetical protein
MQRVEGASEAASALQERRFVSAEFMYRPRPAPGRERIVFDFTLHSRLSKLGARDAVLFICNSQETADSLGEFQSAYPHLLIVSAITNPSRYTVVPGDTPHKLGWQQPASWQRYAKTDRWARIDFALDAASRISTPGYLIMPAHDAVWGEKLLPWLVRLSQRYAQNGQPAVVSPYTYFQHSPVPGASIPPEIIHLLNTAFSRDTLFPLKLRFDRLQAFWGKMGLLPFGVCGPLRQHAAQYIWEDDLEIDRALRELGFGVRCAWAWNPAVYRQALPVFDPADVRRVIERTLHYSLNIPSDTLGSSSLNIPLGPLGRLRAVVSPRFRRYNPQAERLIADCTDEIQKRLETLGASWVDWGDYRYVMRVGHAEVEVWRYEPNLDAARSVL